ncbi:MAG: hypothetical protein QM778_06615 [Myxococcales bacterium]
MFLSCQGECFDSYLRQELSYFDLVRDPHLADFTLLLVRQPAGNGGERWTVTLSRRLRDGAFQREGSESTALPPYAPAHSVRERVLQLSLRVLYLALEDTPHRAAFELGIPKRENTTLSKLTDPWHYWVFTPELGGSGEAGSGYYFVEATSALTVRRITDSSKFRLRGGYERHFTGYRLEDGRRISGDVFGWNGRGVYAHSVRHHMALGAIATAEASEFENVRWHLNGGPIVEINAFPYTENATRQLRTAYQVGVWANRYFERNTEQILQEVRPYHALSLIADVNQPWGSVQWIGQVNMFLDDPRLYRVSMGVVLSLRLFEGLAMTLEGESAYVKDLINLRGRPVTDHELLLWTVQQPTDFMLVGEFALTYTFGSVHNTIVNPRFGRVDLDEE